MPPTVSLNPAVAPDTALVAVPVFARPDGPAQPTSAAVDVDLAALVALGFEGKSGETVLLASSGGGPGLVAVGMGNPAAVTAEGLRRAAASAVRAAWKAPSLTLALLDAKPEGMTPVVAAQAVTEGALLAAYRFTRYQAKGSPCRIERIDLVGRGVRVAAAVERGAAIAAAVAMARDLVNEPPGEVTPTRLAEVATQLADGSSDLTCTILETDAIESERMGGLRGVSLGSDQPPRFIRLSYEPARARSTLMVVGKGITFDSGGLSLKTAGGMATMKNDMTGAAVVLGVMSLMPLLKPSVRVIGLVPATENLPGPKAIKPGDVLRIRNGKTVEVLNTDAEGRLVLADALSVAVEESPDAIVDIATLTGACVVALGKRIAGLMGNHDGLISEVRAAAERAGELVWPLPLPAEYRKDIDSNVADIQNIGDPGGGGALTAGLFLKEFVGDVPWAHLDIAGPSWAESDEGYLPKGATALSLRTVIELIMSGTLPRSPRKPTAARPKKASKAIKAKATTAKKATAKTTAKKATAKARQPAKRRG